MKPFLLVTGDFVRTGGMDRANYALADYLARQGVEVHLVAHRVDSQLQQYPNVHWHSVPKIANSDFISSFLLDAVGRFWARRMIAQGGRVLVNGGNCRSQDVNWVHYVHAAYRPEAKVSVLQRSKIALTHQYFRQTEQHNLRNAQFVITNSARSQSDLIQHQLVPTAKVQTVYYGIDSETFYPASPEEVKALRQQLNLPLEKPIVVFIGALSDRRKGFDVLLNAWRILCQDPTWKADLLVIGQGAELSYWKQLTDELSDRIQFLGFRTDVPDLLRASDCLIAPTRYEAYGLGVHEALCCGIPAIVSASAGIAERYPPTLRNLLLANPSDVESLIDRLKHWNNNTAQYRGIAKTVSTALRRETWDNMAQDILNAIDFPINSRCLVET